MPVKWMDSCGIFALGVISSVPFDLSFILRVIRMVKGIEHHITKKT